MAQSNSNGRVRVIALLYPQDSVSFEEFDKHWSENHGPLFRSLDIVKKNLLKYEQMHFDPTQNALLTQAGVAASPFYGISIFEAESFEKVFAVFTDPEYLAVIVPDENKIFDRSKTPLICGTYTTFLDKV